MLVGGTMMTTTTVTEMTVAMDITQTVGNLAWKCRRLADAWSQVRRCITDSTGAAEHHDVGGTKPGQLREG